MQELEVPQEGNATLAGHRKVMYARGPDGRMKMVPSRGWEVEEIVTRQAVDEFGRLAEVARGQARSGQGSPLRYHMYRVRMDEALLAQTTGLWRWQVRRHLQVMPLERLAPALLARYAQALGMAVDDLKRVD